MAYTSKLPAHRGCFSYARIPQQDGCILYRLYRRDQRGVVHAVLRNFPGDADRAEIAGELNIARHQLRNTVDDVDLALMGVV